MHVTSGLKSYEDIYRKGRELNVAPFDEVISFVFRHKPDKPAGETKILEVGCGAGNNVAFLGSLGFQVSGVELSPIACAVAEERLFKSGVDAEIFEGSFLKLPFKDGEFDMVFDRAALSYVLHKDAKKAIAEINRVLAVGGKFMFTPFSINVNGNSSYTFREAARLLPAPAWKILGAEGVLTTQARDVWGEWTEKESHYRIFAEKNRPDL